jgi:hypothetical protein
MADLGLALVGDLPHERISEDKAKAAKQQVTCLFHS